MIEDTVTKRAQAADAAATAKMETVGKAVGRSDANVHAAGTVAAGAAPPPVVAPLPAKKIDLGTVAAIGVAIGGVGTLVGALLGSMFGLGKWLPLGLLALLLMISGPSMLLAWLKLRRRNLGPILDANGWAINSRAPHQRLVRRSDDRARDHPAGVQAVAVGSVRRQDAAMAPLHLPDRADHPRGYLVRGTPRSIPS